jgi:cellulose biosynthesis protein BcsQ
MKTVAFFNNKGGVGKTSLVYHLAWTFSDIGVQTVVADLDPQANLSASFLDEERLEEVWESNDGPETVAGCLKPLIEGIGDIAEPLVEEIENNLGLVVGNLALSSFEDELSAQWPLCLERQRQPRAFRVISAFWRVLKAASDQTGAELVLVDVGPNLGAINRAALIASDYVVVPLSPDLFSLQGLRNLGPTLRDWREGWRQRLNSKPSGLDVDVPGGEMSPVGYVVLQHAVRLDRPVKAYDRWMARIPSQYSSAILGRSLSKSPTVAEDRNCLAQLKHYRSLMPMAEEARKPMFHLRAADGAIGSHAAAAHQAGVDFRKLAQRIASKLEFSLG